MYFIYIYEKLPRMIAFPKCNISILEIIRIIDILSFTQYLLLIRFFFSSSAKMRMIEKKDDVCLLSSVIQSLVTNITSLV